MRYATAAVNHNLPNCAILSREESSCPGWRCPRENVSFVTLDIPNRGTSWSFPQGLRTGLIKRRNLMGSEIRRICLTFVFLVQLADFAYAQSVKLAWDRFHAPRSR